MTSRAVRVACAALVVTTGVAHAQYGPRPQTPHEPYPYEVRELVIQNRVDGVTLAGTLAIMRDAKPRGALVLLGVAGPNDRDLSFAGHRAFAVIADHLARAGYAVLRMDDRGVGASQGDWRQATYEVMSDDAVSAVQALRATPDLKGLPVGLLGLSEGAAIAALSAARSSDVAFVILASPPGLRGEATLRAQLDSGLSSAGVTGPDAAIYHKEFDSFLDLAKRAGVDSIAKRNLTQWLAGPGHVLVPPYAFVPHDAAGQAELFSSLWWRSQLEWRPDEVLARVRQPALVLGGTRDRILPPAIHHAAIRAALPSAQFVLIDGLNHLLQPATTGLPTEYSTIETTVDPRALAAIVHWLDETRMSVRH